MRWMNDLTSVNPCAATEHFKYICVLINVDLNVANNKVHFLNDLFIMQREREGGLAIVL